MNKIRITLELDLPDAPSSPHDYDLKLWQYECRIHGDLIHTEIIRAGISEDALNLAREVRRA